MNEQPQIPRPRAEQVPQPVDADNTLTKMVPTKNPKALIGYYFGIFSILPFFGILTAIPALVLGILGLRAYKANPEIRGRTHSIVAIICACLQLLGFTIFMFAALRAN